MVQHERFGLVEIGLEHLDRALTVAGVTFANGGDNIGVYVPVFLAVGTSLTVHPAAGLVDLALGAGARVVVVNAEPTPYDDVADLVVDEPIGTALPRLLAFPA